MSPDQPADPRATLRGETILLTGGSGSFGRAFIRHVLADPAFDGRLISMSRNAEMRYRLEQAHLSDVASGRLVVVPGDVRQASDLRALEGFGIRTVLHAAAEKFVVTGQKFSKYTASVNYDGAVNVLAFAREAGAARLLALSTDKATVGLRGEPPENFYGQTKADAEMMFVAASREPGPTIALCRYGNVLASAGSVLGLFLSQREKGRLTLTDARCTRFAMPLDDDGSNGARMTMQDGWSVISAVRLVLDALAYMTPGAIFVPEIPSHQVCDLARTIGVSRPLPENWLRWLWRVVRFRPRPMSEPCEIVEVGIRPGERLHEVLISPSEACRTWARPEGGWVILPTEADEWPGGMRVPDGFFFASNQHPLSVEWKETA